MRHPARHHAVREVSEVGPGTVSEPLLHGVPDVEGRQPVEQVVAHPVRLDDPVVEWVGHPGGAGDELRYGQAPAKAWAISRRPGSTTPVTPYSKKPVLSLGPQ